MRSSLPGGRCGGRHAYGGADRRSELALLALEERMDRIYDRYLAQFTAMEQLVEEMNTLSKGLTSTFDTLPFSPKKD